MQTLIGISEDKHKTLFLDKKRYERPETPYVLGSHLLLNKGKQVGKAGEINKYIHQTYKSDKLPSQWRQYFDGWSVNHPDFVHVLWSDEDNLNLVKQCYPQFVKCYNWLPLMIQKTDFVRLMYLHQFGGIYADLDYECFDNIIPYLPQLKGVMLVESPLTFTEITQNSFMIAEAGHPYLLQVLQLIDEICGELMDQQSVKYPFSKVFQNPFFGKLLHTLSTLFMTGPSTLDKTFVRASLKQSNERLDIQMLPHDQFYEGMVAKHHHNGSWFDAQNLLQLFFIVIAVSVLLIVLFCVLTTHYSTKAVYVKKYKKRLSQF